MSAKGFTRLRSVPFIPTWDLFPYTFVVPKAPDSGKLHSSRGETTVVRSKLDEPRMTCELCGLTLSLKRAFVFIPLAPCVPCRQVLDEIHVQQVQILSDLEGVTLQMNESGGVTTLGHVVAARSSSLSMDLKEAKRSYSEPWHEPDPKAKIDSVPKAVVAGVKAVKENPWKTFLGLLGLFALEWLRNNVDHF